MAKKSKTTEAIEAIIADNRIDAMSILLRAYPAADTKEATAEQIAVHAFTLRYGHKPKHVLRADGLVYCWPVPEAE